MIWMPRRSQILLMTKVRVLYYVLRLATGQRTAVIIERIPVEDIFGFFLFSAFIFFVFFRPSFTAMGRQTFVLHNITS